MELFSVINILSTVSSWAPTFMGLSRFRRMEPVWKAIAILFVFMFFGELFSFFLAYYYKNNLWFYNIILIVEGVVYLSVLGYWMIGRSVQRIFLTSSLLFGAYGFFTFKNHTLSADPVHFGLVRGFVLVSLAAIVMIRRSRISENNLLVDPEFIFATGVLFFNSIGSLFYVINGLDYLIADKSVAFLSVVIYSCSNIVSNLIYAFAIRCHQQRARFSS